MANTSTTHVIEIETGIGEPAFIPLTLGQELQPISVGKKGMWRIESPRVMDVHAFVYFDGSSLFLQSADEGAPATVDNYRVGKAWTELHPPCRIDIGSARLRYRSLLPENVTHAAPATEERLPPSFPKAERPFRPGEFSSAPDDGDSTRLAPLDANSTRHLRRSGSIRAVRTEAIVDPHGANRGATVPAAFAPPGSNLPYAPIGQSPMQGMMPGAAPSMPPSEPLPPNYSVPSGSAPAAYPSVPPSGAYGYPPNASSPPGVPSGAPAGFGGSTTPPGQPPAGQGPAAGQGEFVEKFKDMSVPKRILVFLLPLAFGLTLWSLVEDDAPPPRRRTTTASIDAGAANATSLSPAGGTATSATTKTQWPANVPCPPPGWPPNVPLPCTPNNVTLPPAGDAAAPRDGGRSEVREPKDAGTIPVTSKNKTIERQAVDAVAAGDFARAASLYDELARRDPSNRVYADAARILRNRLDAGGP